jgi:hypothetical protein
MSKESTFTIDFFELAFLAEACIPPTPIARSMFWDNLTNRYWAQMTENERERLFEWLNKNWKYRDNVKEEHPDTMVFHHRYNPDNQYMVKIVYNGVEEDKRAFKMGDRYYVSINVSITPEYIVNVEKINFDDIG